MAFVSHEGDREKKLKCSFHAQMASQAVPLES